MVIPPRRLRLRRLARAPLRAPDANGVEVEIATFQSGDVPDVRHPVARGALARLRSTASARPRNSGRFVATVLLVIIAPLIGVAPIAIVGLTRALRIAPIWRVALIIAAVGVAATAIGFLSSRIIGRSIGDAVNLIVDAILAMGRCASCGYPLDAIPDDGDGVQRCPECGASWWSARIGRQAVPSAPARGLALARSAIVSSALSRSRRRDDRGRLYEPLAFFHVADDDARRRRRPIERAAYPAIVTAVVLPVVIAFGCIGLMLLGPPSALSLAGIPTLIVGGIVILIAMVRRSGRRTVYLELRRRMCPACYGRLRRDGAMLHCASCDGAWKRPPRR